LLSFGVGLEAAAFFNFAITRNFTTFFTRIQLAAARVCGVNNGEGTSGGGLSAMDETLSYRRGLFISMVKTLFILVTTMWTQ
jgi:hypothetical protein